MALFLLLGCAEPVETGATPFVDDGQPHVFIDSPAAGATVAECLAVGVELYNFTLVSPVDESTNVAGHGHFHVVFEGRYIDCEATPCEVPLSSFEKGDVTILARLVGNDHADVLNADGLQVEDSRTFDYSGEGCDSGG